MAEKHYCPRCGEEMADEGDPTIVCERCQREDD